MSWDFQKSCLPIDLELTRRAAELGVPYAQWRLANAYYTGIGIARDSGAAILWYTRAADGGLFLAHRALGTLLLTTDGGAPDAQRALVHIEAAAQAGSPLGCFEAGMRRMRGIGCQSDLKRARAWFRIAAWNESRDGAACVAWLDAMGAPLPDSRAEALRILQRRAASGCVDAMYALGIFSVSGFVGSALRHESGMELLKGAAGAGHVGASRDLGLKLLEGPQVDSGTQQESLKWLLQAAKAGDGWAQAVSGSMICRGIGTPPDRENAEAWFQKSLKSDFAGAGYFYVRDFVPLAGDAVDSPTWIGLLRSSAAAGYLDAHALLASRVLSQLEAFEDCPDLEGLLAGGVYSSDVAAMYALGSILVRRTGGDESVVGYDRSVGEFWLQAAVEENSPDAMFALACYLLRGRTSSEQTSKAVALLGCASALGHARSTARLAYEFNFNRSLIRNHRAAAGLNEVAAISGEPSAQRNLALQLRFGQGVEIDEEGACYWEQRFIQSCGSQVYEGGAGTLLGDCDVQAIGKEAKVISLVGRSRAVS